MVALLFGLTLQATLVDIPAGVYSVPEIAERLSTAEVKVSVAPPVRGRGALISLHNRSQDQALSIVCRALDLQPLSQGRGRIELNADPQIEQRSKAWRIALARSLSERWRLRQDHFDKLADMEEPQLQDLARNFPAAKANSPEADYPTLQMFLQASPLAKATTILASSVKNELNPAILRDAIQRDIATASVPADLQEQIQRRMAAYGKLSNPVMLQRVFARGPGQLSIYSGVFATSSAGLWVSMPTPGALLRFGRDPKTPTKRILFSELVSPTAKGVHGLGEDAKAWLSKSESDTARELKRPGLDRRIILPPRDNALSRLVQQWALESGGEVVMDLAPMGESLSFGTGSLSEVKMSIADFFAQDDSFGLSSVDGVLTVGNRLSFLDRESACPVGLIAHFLRANGDRFIPADAHQVPPNGSRELPLAEELLPLIRSRFSGPRTEWFDYGGYWGLTDLYLNGRSVLLWPGVSGDLLRQIRSSSKGSTNVPLSSFSFDALTPLVESFGGVDFTPEQRDKTRATLERAHLTVRWSRTKAGIRVTTDLGGLTDESMDMGNAISFCYSGR